MHHHQYGHQQYGMHQHFHGFPQGHGHWGMGMHHQHGPPGPPHGPDPNGLPANRGGKVGDVVDDYVIGAEICEGSYGIVRMATLNNPQSSEDKQKKFAIKIVKKERFLETEVSLQQKAEHKNVVSIIKSFPLNDLIYIVLEFCNGGDLFEMVNRKKWLDEPTAAMYFKQMLEAVTVLHAQNICHHDVKLENFFIDKQTVKLGDFGAAEVLSSDGKTQRYKGEVSAPEKLPDATYNGFLADIWQLGKSLHELTFGLRSPKGQGTLNPPHGYTPSPLLVDLLNSMLHSTPTKRPSLEAVLEHKWIKSGGKDARGGWQGEPGSPLTPNNPHHPDRTMFNPPGGGYGWPPHQHMMMQHGQHGFDPFQAQQAAMYGGYQQHQHQQHMFPQQGYGHFQHHQHGMGGHMHGHAHGHGHGGGGYAGKGKGGKKGGNQNKHAGPGGVDRKTPSPVLGNQAENKGRKDSPPKTLDVKPVKEDKAKGRESPQQDDEGGVAEAKGKAPIPRAQQHKGSGPGGAEMEFGPHMMVKHPAMRHHQNRGAKGEGKRNFYGHHPPLNQGGRKHGKGANRDKMAVQQYGRGGAQAQPFQGFFPAQMAQFGGVDGYMYIKK